MMRTRSPRKKTAPTTPGQHDTDDCSKHRSKLIVSAQKWPFLFGVLSASIFFLLLSHFRSRNYNGVDSLKSNDPWIYEPFTPTRYRMASLPPKDWTYGPPAGRIVRGAYDSYEPVPPSSQKTFFIGLLKCGMSLTRSFRLWGWHQTSLEKSHMQWGMREQHRNIFYKQLKPWQRYSFPPNIPMWDLKNKMYKGFKEYQKYTNASLHFLPETFVLDDPKDKLAFKKTLQQGGKHVPWILKGAAINNGDGVSILPPNSKELMNAVKTAEAAREREYEEKGVRTMSSSYVVQRYICNELTWFDGAKFDLRFFWTAVSLDPPIVLFHDGYARVNAAAYNESDFSQKSAHMTNSKYRGATQKVTSDYVWKRVRDHYALHKKRLSKRIQNMDPAEFVRRQMKDIVATLVEAFPDFFKVDRTRVNPENFYLIAGIDFIIDNDLDVWLVEAQRGPGCDSDYHYKLAVLSDLHMPMIDMVEQVHRKQAEDATQNILPLKNMGKYELVAAGDWRYTNPGYPPHDDMSTKQCPQFDGSIRPKQA